LGVDVITFLQNIAAVFLLPIFLLFCVSSLALALLSQLMIYPSLFILWLTARPEDYDRLKAQITGSDE